MSEQRKSGSPPPSVRYGLALAVTVVYGALILGGFVTVVFAVGWITTSVLQPVVGGGEMLSLAVLAAANLLYVLFVYQFAKSRTRRSPGSHAPWTTFSVGVNRPGGGDGDGE